MCKTAASRVTQEIFLLPSPPHTPHLTCVQVSGALGIFFAIKAFIKLILSNMSVYWQQQVDRRGFARAHV